MIIRFDFDIESEFAGFFSVIPEEASQAIYDPIPNLGVIYANCTYFGNEEKEDKDSGDVE